MNESRCTVRVIESNDEFDALEHDWNELANHSSVHIYQTFDWLRTWWKYFGTPNRRLHILLFRSNGNIVGIAPFFVEHKRLLGRTIISRLQLLGSGLSDYVDVLARPGSEEIVVENLVAYLRSHADDWTLCDVESANEHSSLVKFLPRALDGGGGRMFQYQGNICPSVQLPDSEDSLMQNMKSATRENYKRKLKRLQQKCDVQIEVIQHETDGIKDAVETFSKIHGDRWKSLGYPSAFDCEHHRQFHVEFSERFARRGWLKIIVLKANGEPVAVSYAFNFNKRIYLYQCNAYGPEDVMRCSPGLLIRVITMLEGINDGMITLDYLRGDESYKFRGWDVTASKNYLLRIASPSSKKYAGFCLYVISDLLAKSLMRIQREYYEYKRFTMTRSRSALEHLGYLGSKITTLCTLGLNFILRHVRVELPSLTQSNSYPAKQDHPPVHLATRL